MRLMDRLRAFAGIETRSNDLTAQLIALQQARVSGSPMNHDGLGALESAARMYQAAFSSATVEDADSVRPLLSPSVLGTIGRRLIQSGEAVFGLSFEAGRAMLQEAAGWDIRGTSRHPSGWIYRCDYSSPSGTITLQESGSEVLHFRYSWSKDRQWEGISPLVQASMLGRLAATQESRLGDEVAGKRGQLLPLAIDPSSSGVLQELAPKLSGLRGQLLAVETQAGGLGDTARRPAGDWKTVRLGPDPPASIVELQRLSASQVYSACGVPTPLLADKSADATGQRESWRRFLAGSVKPLAEIVQEELRLKLDQPNLTLSFTKLRASDIQGAARSFAALVKSGMDVNEALTVTGLDQ